MASRYSELIKALGSQRIKHGELLAKHTTFNIGGPADCFYEAKTSDELARAVKTARQLGVPYFLLAGGSKLLVADAGFRGLAIKILNSEFQILNSKILTEAGALLGGIVDAAADAGLAGLEFASGIPGTIGGAVVGNAGAWQQTLGEKVLRVKVLDGDGQEKWLGQEDCQFAYRQSRFKKSREVVLEIELQLIKGDAQVIKKKMQGYLLQRQGQPKEPSVGSIFINPKPRAAGELIEACGLKGKTIGNARISPKHANFIVNLGKAKASEVIELIDLAEKRVKEKFGVDLKKEVCLLGFDKIKKDD